MSGRQPVCEDAAAITARIAELRAERMRAIAGCHCPQRTTTGEVVHVTACPFGPAPPSQMVLVLEAMQRARARLRQAGVPIREPTPADDIGLAGLLIARIQALYGTPCATKDTDDHEMPRELNAAGRCPCCAANEVVEWLRDTFIADAAFEEAGP